MVRGLNRERKEEDAFHAASQLAFMGTAYLNISSHSTQRGMKFNTYNEGRKIQESVRRKMFEMMKFGECYSEKYPLIVAVQGSQVDAESLADGYPTPSTKLVDVKFVAPGPTSLELLAGMHRVVAARAVSATLGDRLRKVKDQLERHRRQGAEDEGGADAENPSDSSGRGSRLAYASALTVDVDETKEIIEKVEKWAVQFYDLSSFHPSPRFRRNS